MKMIFRLLLNLFIASLLVTSCSEKPKYSFGSSILKNASLQTPTSLQFGPDGRLYISQQNGIIKIFSIKKNGPNDYAVISTETVDIINKMPNRNDAGVLDTAVKG